MRSSGGGTKAPNSPREAPENTLYRWPFRHKRKAQPSVQCQPNFAFRAGTNGGGARCRGQNPPRSHAFWAVFVKPPVVMFPLVNQQDGAMADNFDAIVIGGGPGGYNAAIRLGQLGLTSACIDKRGSFGGTCLNIGCIPSKALLHASERFHEAQTDFARLGIKAKVELDLPAMMAQKTKVVGELTKGVEFLFKKNKVEGIVGTGRITAPGKISVTAPDGKTREITARHIIIATGSDVAPLP